MSYIIEGEVRSVLDRGLTRDGATAIAMVMFTNGKWEFIGYDGRFALLKEDEMIRLGWERTEPFHLKITRQV